MAGPDTNLSNKAVATDPTGGFLHVIKFVGGIWRSYQIATSVFSQTSFTQVIKEVTKSANFTQSFDAGTKLFSVDFQDQSGAPLIKIGLTPGGSEISLAELPVPSGDFLPVACNKLFSITTTVYISISGGVVNVNFTYSENFF